MKNFLMIILLISTADSFGQTDIQTRIGNGENAVSLPSDGSSCDPRVIEKNLNSLIKANILNATNLTKTVPIFYNCFGCSPETLEEALIRHCTKAQKLSEMLNLL